MTQLTRFFFRPPEITARTAWDVVAWWESRRPAYNVVVGVSGLLSLGFAKAFLSLPPHRIDDFFPWEAVVAFGVLANFFYSAGWVSELTLRRWLGDDMAPAGAAMFRYGFAFSIGLTWLPAVGAGLSWLVRLLQLF